MKEIDDTPQPLIEHLIELRKRLLWSAAAIALAFAVCLYFSNPILSFLLAPLGRANPKMTIINIEVFGGFFVNLKVAFFSALMIAFPVIVNQIWGFVAPGLYRKEKRALLPFLLATPALFLAGASLAYFIAIPMAFKFLLTFQGSFGGVELKAMYDEGKYLGTVMQFLLGFGIAFLLPVLLMLLERAGIVSYEQLKGSWRYAIVAAFGIAALLAPPDIASMFVLALPLCGLYFLSLVAIWFTRRRRERAAEATAE